MKSKAKLLKQSFADVFAEKSAPKAKKPAKARTRAFPKPRIPKVK